MKNLREWEKQRTLEEREMVSYMQPLTLFYIL